jgi:hypothetical protein
VDVRRWCDKRLLRRWTRGSGATRGHEVEVPPEAEEGWWEAKQRAARANERQPKQEAEAETKVPENNWQRCKLSGVKRGDTGTGQGGKKTKGRQWR